MNKKRSWVWGHFIKLSSETSQCTICDKVINCSGSSTSGMRKHLNTHNFREVDDVESDGEMSSPSKIQVLGEPINVTIKSQENSKRSWVWSYFSKVSPSSAKCEICSKLISRSGSSTSGMKNHLQIHNIIELSNDTLEVKRSEYQEVIEEVPVATQVVKEYTRSWVWGFFKKVSPFSAKCGFCRKEISCKGSSTSGMKNHLQLHELTPTSNVEPLYQEFELIEEFEDAFQDEALRYSNSFRASSRSWVWGFFKRLSPECSECGVCDKKIRCRGSSTSGMINHLQIHDLTQQSDAIPIYQYDEDVEVLVNTKKVTSLLSRNDLAIKRSKVKKETQKCFICNEYVGALKNPLSNILEFTNTPLHEVIESFTGVDVTEEIVIKSAICQECFITIERYDNFQHQCQEIQDKISEIYHQSHSEQFLFNEQNENEHDDGCNYRSIDLTCKKCNKVFATIKEMTRHKFDAGQCYEDYDFDNDDVKYDIESFHQTFFSESEKRNWTKSNQAKVNASSPTKNGSSVSSEFKKIVEEEGIEYNIDIFRKAFGIADQESNQVKKVQQPKKFSLDNAPKKQVSQEVVENLRSHGIEYNLSTFRKAFGFNEPNEADVTNRYEADREIDALTLKTYGCLQCEQCEAKFTSRKNFYRHLRTHVVIDKSLQCQKCMKNFKNEATLQVHMVTEHSGQNGPFECPICFKTAPDKSAFRSHYYIHKLERDLLCIRCGATFAHKRSLIMHMMIHDDTRPYSCEFKDCNKKFRTVAKQKTHHRVHTGEKIFECPYCPGKMFAQSYGRGLHIRKHHKNEESHPVTCQICGIKVQTKSKMKMHLVNAHQVMDSEEQRNFSDDSS